MVAGGPGDVWIQWASAQRKSQRSTPDGWRAEYGTARRGAATAAAAAPTRTRQTGARTKQRSRMDVDHGHNKAKATPEEEKRVLLRELSAALETSAAAQSRASRLSVSSLTSGLGSVNSLPTSPLLEPTSHVRDFLTEGDAARAVRAYLPRQARASPPTLLSSSRARTAVPRRATWELTTAQCSPTAKTSRSPESAATKKARQPGPPPLVSYQAACSTRRFFAASIRCRRRRQLPQTSSHLLSQERRSQPRRRWHPRVPPGTPLPTQRKGSRTL